MSGNGANHVRRPNNMGNVRKRELQMGGTRYEARLATHYLGTFDTREEAEKAIDVARKAKSRNAFK